MPFVLDASVAACWIFADEDHPVANLALEHIRTGGARVPSLWWFEIRNVLIVNERRGRITETDTAVFLHGLAQLGIVTDHAPEETIVLAHARRHRLTIYDAAYLELAQRTALPLATLDKDLRSAAQAAGVPLLGERQRAARR